jgi:hypothetical protein
MPSNHIQKRIAQTPLPRERDLNAVRVAIQLIPSVGGALDRLIFGLLDDMRMRRFEETLKEIGERIEELGLDHHVDDNEDFGNLLQDIAPPLSRSSNEDRRRRFRDLILNAAQLQPGDNRWEEVYFASNLLNSIGAPGLAIMAILSRCKNERVQVFSRPCPYVHDAEDDLINHDWTKIAEPHFAIHYDWTVVEEWVRRLTEMRLIWLKGSDARGGFSNVQLTELGQLLVRWSVSDRFSPPDPE